MTTTQHEKAIHFQALHQRPGAFVIANAWDAGSARAGIKGRSFTVAQLQHAGVRRISLATSLYRAAITGLLEAAREVMEQGTFTYLDNTISTPDFNQFMQS